MITISPRFAAFALFALAGSLASAQPAISSLNTSAATPSSRVILRGTGFGDRTSGGVITINGIPAHTARWTDSAISVYIPEQAATGAATIQINTPGGATTAPITIGPRSATSGKLLWKFETDGGAIRHRGQVAPDGTVYFSDNLGFLYSVSAAGALNWIYCADCVNSTGGEGPVSLGHDGAIYVGGNPVGPETNIHAVNPDGTRRWKYTDIWTDCVAGPNVGPDGNVYFVMETAGAGLTCLDPETGARLWATHPDGQRFDERGNTGADIAFGPASSGGQVDRIYTTFDMRPSFQTPIPQGVQATLFSFGLNGSMAWQAGVGGQSIAGGQAQGEPAVGLDGTVYECSLIPPNAWALYAHAPSDGSTKWSLYLPPGNVITEPTAARDGTVYVVRNTIHIHAVRPNGSVEWTYTDPTGSLFEAAVESPDGRVVISAGSVGDTLNFSGHVRAVSGAGQNLWSVYLPRENSNSVPIVPRTRAFYSPDSSRAYLGTSGGGVAGEEHAYLVALDTSALTPTPRACSADVNGDGDSGTDADIEAFFACLGGMCCPSCIGADFNGDGDVGTDADIEAFFRVLAGNPC